MCLLRGLVGRRVSWWLGGLLGGRGGVLPGGVVGGVRPNMYAID